MGIAEEVAREDGASVGGDGGGSGDDGGNVDSSSLGEMLSGMGMSGTAELEALLEGAAGDAEFI